jgi:hypothetical protein
VLIAITAGAKMQVAHASALHLPHRWTDTHTIAAVLPSVCRSIVWLQVPILALLYMTQLAMRRYLAFKPAYYPAVSSPSTLPVVPVYNTAEFRCPYVCMDAGSTML